MSNLDSFVSHSKSVPESQATSQQIRDRASTFVANIFRASTPAQAQTAINHLTRVIHGAKPATHEIAAWRCMVLKPGKTGLEGEDDFVVQGGSEDDGETWAGARVLKVMKEEAVMDAVVVVSRWYGGTMLGPVRFTHIETCAREVCHTFRVKDELDDCISTLSSLDDILGSLRLELLEIKVLASAEVPPSQHQATRKLQDYSQVLKDMDLAKAKRLVTARESAIKNTKELINKAKAPATTYSS